MSGKFEKVFDNRIKVVRRFFGFVIFLLFVGAALVAVMSIFMLRSSHIMSEELSTVDKGHVPLVAAIVNAVQIKIMNFIYSKVGIIANDWENFKTQAEYD